MTSPEYITLSTDDLLALLDQAWIDGYQLGRRQIRAAFSAELFWMRFRRIGKCLVWTGPLKPNGYGQVRVNGKHKHVHVLAWELTHGPVPAGYEVCHNCPDGDNRACGDPDHLWLGTRLENMHDMIRKGRYKNGRVGKPGLAGEQHPQATWTAAQVRAIRERARAGERVAALAAEFGMSPRYVRSIRAGTVWKNL